MAGGMACVLFTDLVGSTELMARLGDATFDALRTEHFHRLGRVVSTHQGTLVKTTGDGVLATFGSAVDALAAAVAAQQATEAHARAGAVPLELRVGLALGEVAAEEGDVFGTPVVEAARLVAVARPGQILCSAMVSMVAGSRAKVELTDLGTMELKGLPGPLAVQEVAWAPAPVTAVPIPPLLTDRGRVFVGRDHELERLRSLWKETVAGERRVALLGGEPGVGKTRLAAELAEEVHGQGAMILAGRCDEDLGVPYQPFVEALRHYLAHVARPCLGRHGGELARLVPDLAAVAPGLPEPLRSDPETERYRLFDALSSWLADASAERPVLLILDDLQWAAKPTLLLLRHVLRSADPARLLVVGTYRDTDIGRGHPLTELLADLRRGGGAERVPVTGLDAPGVAAFLEAAAGHGLDEEGEDLARAVWTETEGNPFFVAEVLRHLSESGVVERRGGRWEVAAGTLEELGIPEGVRDVVGRRLSRLSEAANRVLTVAAVVGLEFEPAVVAPAGGLAEDDVLAALEEAVGARLVVEVPAGTAPRNRFSHALVRATLYDELSAGRRVALHRKVAEAIEAVYARRLDDHLPALAHHWARASAPAAEAAQAVHYATRAGDQALALLAHDEAASYYASALELLDASAAPAEAPERLELMIALGEAQRRAGDASYRDTLLRAARLAEARGDTTALARAALANNRDAIYSAMGVVDTERVAVLESALRGVTPEDSPTRARLLAILAIELFWSDDLDRRIDLSDQAAAMARRLDDPSTLTLVLTARCAAIMGPGTRQERLATTEELLAAAGRLGDPAATSMAWAVRARTVLETGNLTEAEQATSVSLELAADAGQPALLFWPTWISAGIALGAGRMEEAEVKTAAILDVGARAGHPDTRPFHSMAEFQLRFEQGRLAEVEDSFAVLARDLPRLSVTLPLLALLYCELGREHEARPILEAATAAGISNIPVDTSMLRTVTTLSVVATRLGDKRAAADCAEALNPYADHFVVMAGVPTGAVHHYLGLLAASLDRLDEADARFAAAVDAHERAGMPRWLARSRLEWARTLANRRGPGDADRARVLLGRVAEHAYELGMAHLDRQAAALLSEVAP